MMQQTSSWPTNKNIAGSIAGAIAAPLSTIVDYMINGFGFGCWADPTATAVACSNHLPGSVMLAIAAVFTGIAVLGVGYAMPPGQNDHIQPDPPGH